MPAHFREGNRSMTEMLVGGYWVGAIEVCIRKIKQLLDEHASTLDKLDNLSRKE